MRLLWSSPAGSKAELLLAAERILRVTVPACPDSYLLDTKFPFLIYEDGSLQRESFAYLLEIHRRNGASAPSTLRTYAESLLSWFLYLERSGQSWYAPARDALPKYRTQILEGALNRGRRRNARTTANLRLQVVLSFYGYLGAIEAAPFIQTVLGCNPAAATPKNLIDARRFQARRLQLRARSRRPRALTPTESEAILTALNGVHKLVFFWSLATGLRRSSLISLKKEDVPAPQHPIEYVSVNVKGGGIIDVPVTKSLAARTLDYIDTDRRVAQARALKAGLAAQPCLFLARDGRPLTASAYYQAFKRACQRVGIKAHPHMTRHTFATRAHAGLTACLEPGSNINVTKVIQHWLGHRNVASTELYLEQIVAPSSDVLGVLSSLQGGGDDE
ncbi:tyrosine-type recombinase/integrase [Lysobacter changpingensis]|uniref:tyrosine-type recombinase/integrase n=1 Tax=Lysobacter changpingensis TaxID=2792784 RepID=UPI001A8F5B1E